MGSSMPRCIWPEWKFVKQIGMGSYGTVYEAVRHDDFGVESRAAIKVISIPQNEAELDTLRTEGLDYDESRTYMRNVVDAFVNEVKLMVEFKGVQNIVSVEDYKVVERKDEIGWDISIRMELLTPLPAYTAEHSMTEWEVAKMGSDICAALEACAKDNVIHRDIKPANIFINDFGDFKLGDFGIARQMESMTTDLSRKGTGSYMAPEVEKGERYDSRADLYSLGLVLYFLMNNNRLPFLDLNKQILTPTDREIAIRRRLSGETVPAPCNASPAMTRVILCACAYDPKRRFATAKAMRNALQAVMKGTHTSGGNVQAGAVPPVNRMTQAQTTATAGSPTQTTKAEQAPPVPPAPPRQDMAESAGRRPSEKKLSEKAKKWLIAVCVIAAAAVVLLILFFGVGLAERLTGRETVDLDDYVSLDIEGYNGYGTADVTFDSSALGENFDGEIRLSRRAGEEGYQTFADVIDAFASVTIAPASGLSNGDEVTVTWDVDSEAIGSLVRGRVEILDEEFDDTVNDLTELEYFDAFADVSVIFDGISPDTTAALAVGGGELSADDYSLSKDSSLEFGEVVTVSIDGEAADELAAEKGRYPSELSKDYTVDGVAYAVTSLDQIPEDAMDGMRTRAEQAKNEKTSTWDPVRYRMQSIDYVGSYLLSKKPGADAEDLDIIYMVFRLGVTMYGKNEDGSDANVDFDYYWYGGFRNGIMQPDGTFTVDYEDMLQPEYSPDKEFSEGVIVTAYDYTNKNVDEQENTEVFDGYEDLNSMFDSLVASREDNYDYDSTVGEQE